MLNLREKEFTIMSEMTYEDFLNSANKFVLISYRQDGSDPEYDDLCDSFAPAWEKIEYLAQWDYGIENETGINVLSREELIEEAVLPCTNRYVEIVHNVPYLLTEQVGTGSALYRAVSE